MSAGTARRVRPDLDRGAGEFEEATCLVRGGDGALDGRLTEEVARCAASQRLPVRQVGEARHWQKEPHSLRSRKYPAQPAHSN